MKKAAEKKPRLRRPAPVPIERWVRVRIYVAASVLTLCLLGVAYKAYGIQIRQTEHFKELAERQHLRTVEVPAPRGVIFDATGNELAATAQIDSIYANPRAVVDVAGTAERLAQTLDLDVRSLEAKLASKRYFVWIKRHVTQAEAGAAMDLGLKGLALTSEPRRFYPSGQLAATLLGFAGIDGEGLDGLELTMNDLLRGKRAVFDAVRDASGKAVITDEPAAPQPGASVHLTIDSFIQFASERALAAAIEEHDARAGTVIVLDVKGGGVLAMANYPTFDPNRPSTRKKARNRAITDAYEIGSIVKIFTVAAALEAGLVRPDTVIDVEHGRYKIGRKVIRDSHRDWELTVSGVLKRSSNVGAVKIGRRLGAERLHEALKRYGFGSTTDIELPGERSGLIRPPSAWGEIGLATVSFGYGLSATPLQLTASLAAVGNGGVYHEPRIIAEVKDASGRTLHARATEGRRIMGAQTAAELLPMLESVFEKGRKTGGTARKLSVPGFLVGGKTGTAHKIDPETKKYSDDLYLSSFAGLAPIDDPRIAVLVIIDEPHGEYHYGADVAGPAWTQIVGESLRYLGVPASDGASEAPADERTDDRAAATIKPIAELGEEPEPSADAPLRRENEVLVPDFTGHGIARALELARERGIRVEIEGSGRATAQSVAPGYAHSSTECQIVFKEPQ